MQPRVLWSAAPEEAPTHGARHCPAWSPDSIVGARLRLERLCAIGRRTEVWQATTPSGELVAVKRLKPNWMDRDGAAELIRREYALLAGFEHPHILATHALIDGPDSIAIVSEYLSGGDLVSLVGAEPSHWIEAARGALLALQALHSKGYVHRDVKARNLMFDTDNRVRLIDFGSAAQIGGTSSGHGTTPAHRRLPAHAIVVNDNEDDLFAFAVLLYELMSGRLPYGATPSARRSKPPNPPLKAELTNNGPLRRLENLVLTALAPQAQYSIGSLSTFLDVIESVIASPNV